MNNKSPKIKPLETSGIFQVTLGTILFFIATVVIFANPSITGNVDSTQALRVTILGFLLGLLGLRILFRRQKRLKKSN
ncbi:MAG: hypothetical protein RLZZ37_631 [Actinomycetota bacterium]|jgi:uncharacterized membrane protein